MNGSMPMPGSERVLLPMPPIPGPPRSLPPNDAATIQGLTSLTLENHYIAFILYCNPAVPDNLSTVELRKGFRAVPRADGRAFETLTFFRLVSKLEKGEIPSWAALVTELGVEPPDMRNGDSKQKLQQYGVRLKKWARGYRIDAFFQYLLGNTRSYFTEIPKDLDSLYMEREGIAMEDDLALRALIPDLRPQKRRRRGKDDDAESIGTPNKRLRAGTPSTVDGRNSPRPDFWGRVSQSPAPTYMPHPSNSHIPHVMAQPPRPQTQTVYDHSGHLSELFSVATRAIAGEMIQPVATPVMTSNTTHIQHMNPWPEPNGRSHDEYPQSAIDIHPPVNMFDSPDLNDGSRSAHPLAALNDRVLKPKKRGVSAMWDFSTTLDQTQNGRRQRGRPAKNLAPKHGLEIWSVKQSIETERGNTPTFLTDGGGDTSQQQVAKLPIQQPDLGIQITAPTSRKVPTQKLSLTVPQQPSGNVRLATPPMTRELANQEIHPPPRLTLNDDGSLSRPRSSISKTREKESDRERGRQRARLFPDNKIQRRSSADFFNVIDEEASQHEDYDMDDNDFLDDSTSNTSGIDWKHRAQVLARRLKQAQDELRRVKKAVLEAVM